MAFKDLQGLRFNRLTLIRYLGASCWECRCDCGAITKADSANIQNGHTKSCGCARGTHHMARSTEYMAWANIKARCFNPATPNFKDYGGRGVSMASEWRDDFAAFLAHVGKKPSAAHTIERINNSLGYVPGNVRWATQAEQAVNMRSNHYVEIDGHKMTIGQWARKYGLHQSTVCHRIARGMTEREAILTPPRNVGRRVPLNRV